MAVRGRLTWIVEFSTRSMHEQMLASVKLFIISPSTDPGCMEGGERVSGGDGGVGP